MKMLAMIAFLKVPELWENRARAREQRGYRRRRGRMGEQAIIGAIWRGCR